MEKRGISEGLDEGFDFFNYVIGCGRSRAYSYLNFIFKPAFPDLIFGVYPIGVRVDFS